MTAAHAHRTRLVAVFALTLVILVIELVGSVLTNSLALLADAGHMLTDAVGVGLALLAIVFGSRPATAGKSFGYYRLEILAAAANAVLLFGMAAFILFEAVQRLRDPSEVLTGPMLVIAALGLMINLVSLRLLHAGSKESLTVRGAYLEVLGDLFGSVAVLVAGVVIMATGWNQADPIASVAIAVLILPRGWRLLSDAIDVLLQATPKGIDMAEVRQHLLGAENVVDIHDLHAWSMTSGMNVVSAHVVMAPGADPAAVLDEICRCLSDDFDMEHSTIQLETSDRRRLEDTAHP